MKNCLIILFLAFTLYIVVTLPKDEPPPPIQARSVPPALLSGCQKHIELLSAAALAQEYGRSEAWVVGSVEIRLWEKNSPQGKGSMVGHLLPGSRALIIEEGPDDYLIRSPLDNSIGWVSKIQTSHTLHQDVESRQPCEP